MNIYESLKGPGVQKSRALLSEVCVSWMRWGGSRFSTTLYKSSKKPHKRREMERSHTEDLLLRGSEELHLGRDREQKLEQ